MIIEKVILNKDTDVELKDADIIAKEALHFRSNIFIDNTNAKSVLALLTLELPKDKEIEIQCDGEDEAEAIESIVGTFKIMNKA